MAGLHDLTGRLRAWSYRRQRLGSYAATDPLEALGGVVGVYSSHPTAPLALLCRSTALDAARFAAMEQQREAVRLPAMRESVFLLATATASRIFAATRQPLEQHARRLRYAELEWDDYARLKERVLEVTQQPIAATDLQRAVRSGDETASEARIMTGVRVMALEGVVLRLGTSLRSDALRYVAAEAWLGQPLESVDPEQALAWLAEAYLRGYGPARLADFAWWSGAPKRRAQAALAALGERVIDIGDGLLLPADLCDEWARVAPLDSDEVAALPKWDAYTMGYAPDGRQRLVDDQHLTRAYSQGGGGTLRGDGLPLVLRGGRAVATWSHRFTGSRMQVTVRPFAPDPLPRALYEHAFDAAGTLLGATSVEVVDGAAGSSPI